MGKAAAWTAASRVSVEEGPRLEGRAAPFLFSLSISPHNSGRGQRKKSRPGNARTG